MSLFDDTCTTWYYEKLGFFLSALSCQHQTRWLFRPIKTPTAADICKREDLVNRKAARAEEAGTLRDRIRFARDYLTVSMTDKGIAARLGISLPTYYQWMEGRLNPNQFLRLAAVLMVPVEWLRDGGEEKLPADSHIGVRVGKEAAGWREALFDETLMTIFDLPESTSVAWLQGTIEEMVRSSPDLSMAARRAGGRWQATEKLHRLVFAPWVPVPPPQRRAHIPQETDDIIKEESARQLTPQLVEKAITDRCQVAGLPMPKATTHNRVRQYRHHEDRFGLDINEEVLAALRKARS